MLCGNEFESMVVWCGRGLNEDCAAGELLRSGGSGSRKVRAGRIVEREIRPGAVGTLKWRALYRSEGEVDRLKRGFVESTEVSKHCCGSRGCHVGQLEEVARIRFKFKTGDKF